MTVVTPGVRLYERLEKFDSDQLELLAGVLEKLGLQADLDQLTEDDMLVLLDQIDAPKPQTATEVIKSLDDDELQELVTQAPTPADKYLAQAEQLMRSGALVEPTSTNVWPIDYSRVYAWRQYELARYEQDPLYFEQRRAFYASGVDGCVAFINHWMDTHDPRNAGLRDSEGRRMPVSLPLIMFTRQEELVRFMFACMEAEADGLVEKSRDMGATWVAISVAVWMWLFWDAVTFGFGSATAVKLDRSGDSGSIFYKLRDVARGLPKCFRPKGLIPGKHLLDKRVYNPDNGSGIVGEVGDEVGRGSRTRVYVVDEAAHFEHPEAVTAALSDTTRVRIDVSSVSGLGTVFHRMRQGGVVWEPGQPVVQDRTNVFIMDWRHHPTKTNEWYERRRAKFVADGLEHIFAQEVDRDYAAALQGTIIPKKWLEACVDAHLRIGTPDEWLEGAWFGGLDVADGGVDTNALVKRKGWVVNYVDQWGERDTATTTRRALKGCADTLPILLSYDCIGVGSGVKAESNRLADEGLLPKGLRLEPWNAGGKVQWPGKPVIENDDSSPRNKDYFANLKAQAWWDLRMRVYRTYRAITEGELSPIDDMVSFDSAAIGRLLYKLIEELAQPTAKPDTRMKLVVDKVPDGAASPNLGDACVECCYPLRERGSINYKSLSAPLLVDAGENCLQCGARGVRELGRGCYQCLKCGHIGDRDDGTVDVRARGKPPQQAARPSQQGNGNGNGQRIVTTTAQVPRQRSSGRGLPAPFIRR